MLEVAEWPVVGYGHRAGRPDAGGTRHTSHPAAHLNKVDPASVRLSLSPHSTTMNACVSSSLLFNGQHAHMAFKFEAYLSMYVALLK